MDIFGQIFSESSVDLEQIILEIQDCAKNFNSDIFQITGRVSSLFHLAVLKSIYIEMKKLLLCTQKESIFSLGFH